MRTKNILRTSIGFWGAALLLFASLSTNNLYAADGITTKNGTDLPMGADGSSFVWLKGNAGEKGKVTFGTDAANPKATINTNDGSAAFTGAVKVGTTTDGCSSTNESALRYDSGTHTMQYCNGTSWQTIQQRNCSYQYASVVPSGEGNFNYHQNYNTIQMQTCINNRPDDSWQFVGYDVCYEDDHDCSTDGLLCFYSKAVCP